MIAKFDSYRKFETPMLYVCNPGCVYRNGLLTNVSGILTDTSDIEIIPTFNATSKLNFRCYKVKRDDAEENAHAMSLYRSLRNRKLIYADGIGFFVITDFVDGYSDKVSYKDITAESCEVELRTKNLPYIENGTYKFYTGEAGNPGMIEKLMAYAPLWTLGDIDVSVVNRYRTFEDVDFTKNILGFMLEDLQDAYECLFVFDILNRVVNIYDKANYVHETDIHLTKEDMMTSLNVTESSDDLYTALSVTGDEELSINAVNPIGTNVIYNFDYYLDWMTPALSAKVDAWQQLVESYKDEYYNVQLARYGNLTTLSTLNSELQSLNTQLTMYKRCRENMVAEASDEDIAAYNAVIVSVGGVPIPEQSSYLWVMYADDAYGTNITASPYGKNYIGLAWDKGTQVASNNPSDYSWFTFRNGETFPRTVDGSTKYTWVIFSDSIVSGMSNDPDEKAYIGVALDKSSSTKSSDYGDYSYSLIESGGIGLNETLATILSLIEQVEADVSSAEAQITALESTVESQENRVNEIHNAVSMNEYFTDEDMDELSNYIIEGTYEDEYITVTENMTYAERFAQMKILYDRSVAQLEKVAYPTQEFSLDVENFIFIKEFEHWSEQLETGCLINVEIDDDDVAALFLTSFEVNYEDKKLTMTFGNRYNRFDPKALFDKVLGNISKTANTLAYIKDTIYPIESGEFNKMKEALETSRTLTKNAVLSSENEQVIIDDTGYTGRRLLSDGTVDPKQIKINGRNIVFTDDAWETCKTAIGEILLSGNASAYGVNAEVLLGNIIMGNELHIINANGEDMFQVTENNVMVRVGEEYAKQEDTISGVDVMYCRASSSSVCDATTITVAWSTTSPAWVSGEYIWQKTVTTFDDGSTSESSPTCLSGATGQTGKGVSTSVISYAVSDNGQQHPTNESDWGASIPTINEGQYLWTRTVTTYTDGSSTTAYSVSRDGVTGRGIAGVTNYYAVSTSSSTAPSSWNTTVPTMTATNKYLWNYEVVSYDDNSTPTETAKRVIGVYGDKGSTGKGISSITEYYLASPLSSGVTTSTSGWTTAIQTVTATNKYLWNYEQVNYTEGNPYVSTPVIIGTFSNGITSSAVTYAVSTSGTVAPETGWDTTIPTVAQGQYLWTRTITEYSDGTQSTSYSVGREGTDGSNGRHTAVVYLYKRATSAPSIDWSSTLTYNFTTNTLTSTPSGWSTSIPSGTNPIYMTAATASSTSNTDTIAYTEWATPVLIAQNGSSGSNGSNAATIFLYQRAASASGITKPSTALTYTFATGALSGTLGSWSQSIPDTDGNPCFVIQATAISTSATDTIAANEWSEITRLVVDGEDGDDGVGVMNSSVTYVVSNSGSTPPSTGWSDTFPGTINEGQYLWTRTVTTYTDGSSSTSYSVSANGVGIATIEEEYYLSSSNATQSDGEWTTTPPVWTSGKYIWTRSHIYWDNGNESTTTPVLNQTYNYLGATLDDCVTEININKTGIEQNTQYYQELYGQVSKINAYIQTGVVSTDEQGKTSFGVKIGENLSSIDAYIVSGSTALSAGWLSDSDGGTAFTPMEAVLYLIKTAGTYYNKTYRWTGSAYEEASSEGTLSSIFTSSELGFYDTGEKTAYFSNKNLNVRTVRTNKILLSEDVIADTSTNNWQIGIDNGFYLKWIGS